MLFPPDPRSKALAALEEVLPQIAQGASERERDRTLPFAAFALFRQTGISTWRIPAERGGLGGSLEALFTLLIRLAAADAGLAHALRIHYDVTENLALSEPDDFTRIQTGRVVSGAIFSGAAAERHTPKPGEIRMTLERRDTGYEVSGEKYYTTGTAFADYVRINLRNERGETAAAIIPVSREGMEVVDDWDGMGQRTTASGTLRLHRVRVLDEEVAPLDFSSLVNRHCSTLRQLFLSAVSAGIAQSVLADAVAYVRGPSRAAGHSDAAKAHDDAFILQATGDIAADAWSARAIVLEAARALDLSAHALAQGADDAQEIVRQSAVATAQAQIAVSRLTLKASERLFDTGGASATSRAHNFDRHWRNLRTITNHNPLAHKARVLGDFHVNGVSTHLDAGRVF